MPVTGERVPARGVRDWIAWSSQWRTGVRKERNAEHSLPADPLARHCLACSHLHANLRMCRGCRARCRACTLLQPTGAGTYDAWGGRGNGEAARDALPAARTGPSIRTGAALQGALCCSRRARNTQRMCQYAVPLCTSLTPCPLQHTSTLRFVERADSGKLLNGSSYPSPATIV